MGDVIQKLRDSANGEACVACGVKDDTTVLCHYFGPRRHSYAGGMGIKGHDFIGAFLCANCHRHMDAASRNKELKWEQSELFLHYCALTWIRWFERGVVK
jgi:hypothetical protein